VNFYRFSILCITFFFILLSENTLANTSSLSDTYGGATYKTFGAFRLNPFQERRDGKYVSPRKQTEKKANKAKKDDGPTESSLTKNRQGNGNGLIRPYIGFNYGFDSSQLNANFIDNGSQANYGLDGNAYGVFVGIHLNPFHSSIRLSAEGFYENIVGAQASDTNITPLSPSFQKKNNMGVSLLPGYQFTDKMQLFIRLGSVWSEFKYKNTLVGKQNISKYDNGFQYGLGALYNLFNHIGIRAEYDRINYANLNYTGTGGLNENLDYQSNEFKLGLEVVF